MHDSRFSSTIKPLPQSPETRTLVEDFALIERVLSGESQAFFELISPHQRAVHTVTFSLLRNEADAEEAAQEAFFKAFAHLTSFRGEARFSTWLIQIAVNEARAKRRKYREALYAFSAEGDHQESSDHIAKDYPDWRDTPSEALQRAELRRALQNAITSFGFRTSRGFCYARRGNAEYFRNGAAPEHQSGSRKDSIAQGKVEDARSFGAQRRRIVEHMGRRSAGREALVTCLALVGIARVDIYKEAVICSRLHMGPPQI